MHPDRRSARRVCTLILGIARLTGGTRSVCEEPSLPVPRADEVDDDDGDDDEEEEEEEGKMQRTP